MTLTGCFFNSDLESTRDYAISLEANKAIPIDRIDVMYSVGNDSTYSSYRDGSIFHTSIDSTTDKYSILFTLKGDKKDQAVIEYIWYSNGIAILSNRNEFVLGGAVDLNNAHIDSSMVDILIAYHTNKMVENENSNDPVHQQNVYAYNSGLFSSLIASNIVGADSATAINLYRAYKTQQITLYGLQIAPDTLRILSQSRDSLEYYGYPFTELLGYLFPETENFDDLVAILPQTIDIPVKDSTTTIDEPQSVAFTISGSIVAHAAETEYIHVIIVDTLTQESVTVLATKELLNYSAVWRKVLPQVYRVDVQFYSSDSIQTGIASVYFDAVQQVVTLPGVDAWNGKPTITLSAVDTLSINDQFVFYINGSDTLQGTIDSMQMKIGTNDWATVTTTDTLFNAPATQVDSLWLYGKVIDTEGNVVVDSTLTTVLLDLPTLTATAVDTVIDLSDSIRISWVGSDKYGSIINYSVRPLEHATVADWIDAGLSEKISFAHVSGDGVIRYLVRATDDDTQMVYDTVSVLKLIDPPIATSVSISGSAEQNGSLVVSYLYSDHLGDLEGATTFQWLRGSDSIAGATTISYTPNYADSGKVLSCIVTPVALTGYATVGEAVIAQFANQVTGFTAPVASNVSINGSAQFGQTLQAFFDYDDAESDKKGTTQFQWYRDDSPIVGATLVGYQVTAEDVGHMLSVQVIPVALTGHIVSGAPVVSEGVFAEGTLPSPAIDTPSGTFAENQSVTISTSVENGTIHYTIDGSKPTEQSESYTGAIEISSTVVLYAAVFKSGWNSSIPAVETYIINGSTSPPVISADNKESATPFDITAVAGEGIIYVTQSTDVPLEPNESSTVVNGPITIDRTMNYNFKVFRSGFRPSITVSRSYGINGQAIAPKITPSNNDATGISVTALGTGIIYYTTDGTDPSDTSEEWIDREVISTGTYRFRIYREFYLPSDIVTATYTINGQLAAPSVDVVAGAYATIQNIAVTEPSGSEVFYTTDGQEPTQSSTPVTGTITIDGTATYQFKAFKDGWVSSPLTIRTYTMEIAEPVVTEDANHATEITVIAEKSVGTIYYTSGVTSAIPEPSASNGTLYSGVIPVRGSAYYKFKEYRDGWRASPTVIRHYVINGSATTPIITPDRSGASSVAVTASVPAGTIHYTFVANGIPNDPTDLSATWSDHSVTSTGTYKFIVFHTGFTPSAVVSATYTINGLAPYSSITTDRSASSSIPVSVSASGSSVYFSSTTNGTEPGRPSTSSPWSDRTLSGAGTHKYTFLITRSGYVEQIVSRTYTINGLAPYSSITTDRSASSSIPVSVSASGSSVYFSSTTNGTEPGRPSTTSPWSNRTLSGAGTHKYTFLITRSGYVEQIVSRTYTINGLAPYSSITTDRSGPSSIPVSVSASGSTVYFSSTTNGTEPGRPSTSSPWSDRTVSGPGTHKYTFLITRSGYVEQIVSRTYTINGLAPYSSITTDRSAPSSIPVSVSASGSTVYFSSTTNGTEPGRPSTSSPWSDRTVSGPGTHRYTFLITRSGYVEQVVSRTYTINGLAPYSSITTNRSAASSIPVSVSASGSSVYFSSTTNGTEPGRPSTTSPWSNRTLSGAGTHKYTFLITRSGYVEQIVSRTYTINGPAPTPVVSNVTTGNDRVFLTASGSGTIHFTYNASASPPNPTSGSAQWSNRFILPSTDGYYRFINAVPGYEASAAVERHMRVTPTFALPTQSLSCGTYRDEQQMTVSYNTAGTLYYTTNGATPTTSSTRYTGAITVDRSTNYKFRTIASGWNPSPVRTCNITLKVSNPALPPSQTFNNGVDLILWSFDDSEVHYTRGTTEPTESNGTIVDRIHANYTQTLNVKAFRDGWTPSDMISETYTFVILEPDVTDNNTTAAVGSLPITVDALSGATVRYTHSQTSKPSNPISTSSEWSNTSITSPGYYNFKVFNQSWTASSTVERFYKLKLPTPSISATPVGNVKVTVSSTVDGAQLRYRVSGGSWISYTGPVSYPCAGPGCGHATITFEAQATLTNWEESNVRSQSVNF